MIETKHPPPLLDMRPSLCVSSGPSSLPLSSQGAPLASPALHLLSSLPLPSALARPVSLPWIRPHLPRLTTHPTPLPTSSTAMAPTSSAAAASCLLAALVVSLAGAAAPPAGLTVVDMRNANLTTQLAVQVCIGLTNREGADAPVSAAAAAHVAADALSAGAPPKGAYGILGSQDLDWLSKLYGITNPSLVAADAFLHSCMAGVAQHRRIRYHYDAQKLVAPNLMTLAGVLRAVPLEDNMAAASGAAVVFDALQSWAGFASINATRYMFQQHANATTALAMLNPGLDVHKNQRHPPLTGTIKPDLVDFVVSRRVFTFYLNMGCIPGTEEHALLDTMVTSGTWPLPIAVFGYDDTWPEFGGDLFEAETTCAQAHNMGQVASANFNNLGYFARAPAVTSPIKQNPLPRVTYNASRTYMAFIVGDGDNLDFLKGTRADWMEQRLAMCANASANACPPLSWTLSPHIAQLAPDMLHWYYQQARVTGRDYFLLPPSGHLYAYPGLMPPDAQAAFVSATEDDVDLYSTDGTVEWEWFTAWQKSMDTYYPRYAAKNRVRGLFAVNVPFMLPIPAFGEDFYKVFANRTVVFRPREWRGTQGSSSIPLSKREYLTIDEMAAEINGYKPGTVSQIYLTSDGGANLTAFAGLAQRLAEHVEVVPTSTLVDMALAAEGLA